MREQYHTSVDNYLPKPGIQWVKFRKERKARKREAHFNDLELNNQTERTKIHITFPAGPSIPGYLFLLSRARNFRLT
jgi:hypothetical protein